MHGVGGSRRLRTSMHTSRVGRAQCSDVMCVSVTGHHAGDRLRNERTHLRYAMSSLPVNRDPLLANVQLCKPRCKQQSVGTAECSEFAVRTIPQAGALEITGKIGCIDSWRMQVKWTTFSTSITSCSHRYLRNYPAEIDVCDGHHR